MDDLDSGSVTREQVSGIPGAKVERNAHGQYLVRGDQIRYFSNQFQYFSNLPVHLVNKISLILNLLFAGRLFDPSSKPKTFNQVVLNNSMEYFLLGLSGL